jgi:hypothetical protein
VKSEILLHCEVSESHGGGVDGGCTSRHCHQEVHMSWTPDPVLAHILTACLFKIYINIILPSTLAFRSGSFPSGFNSNIYLRAFLISFMRLHVSTAN